MANTPAAIDTLHRSLAVSVTDSMAMIDVAVRAIASLDAAINLTKAVNHLESIQHPEQFDPGAASAHVDRLERASPAASLQREKGFPFLHGLAAVSLWSELEAFVEDAAVELLLSWPKVWHGQSVKRIRAPIAEFMLLSERDRSTWMVQALQRELALGLKTGPGQFESLMAALGLGGAIAPDVRASLVELCAVRNLLVHRRGIADQRFIEMSPWTNAVVGAEVRVNHIMLHRFGSAVLWYATEVMRRIRSHVGDSTAHLSDLLNASLVTSSRTFEIEMTASPEGHVSSNKLSSPEALPSLDA